MQAIGRQALEEAGFEVERVYGAAGLQDWGTRTRLSVRFKVMSGFNPDPNFRGEAILYVRSFDANGDGGPPTTVFKAVSEVVASGIVRSGDDRVAVLVFVNRPTTNKQLQEPVVYKDQVTVTMQKVGDEWLVDDLMTSPAAG